MQLHDRRGHLAGARGATGLARRAGGRARLFAGPERCVRPRAPRVEDLVRGMAVKDLTVEQNFSMDSALIYVATGESLILESLLEAILTPKEPWKRSGWRQASCWDRPVCISLLCVMGNRKRGDAGEASVAIRSQGARPR